MDTGLIAPARPAPRVYVRAEAKCYLCGTTSGSVVGAHASFAGMVLFQRAGEPRATRVPDWRRLRCVRCGSAVYMDNLETITIPDVDARL